MNRNKKKRDGLMVAIVLLLVVMIGIGYAALSRTLNISGKSTIAKQSWNIYFDEDSIAVNASKGVTVNSAPTVTADDDGNMTKINYDVKLNKPGDYYEFTVDVVNGGTIDAILANDPEISAVSDFGDDVSNYFNYTVVEVYKGSTQDIFAEDFTLNVEETRTIKVRVEFSKELSEEDLQEADKVLDGLSFEMYFEQA